MRIFIRLAAAAALALPAISHALEPEDYMHLPAIEYGEKEIDFKYGTAKLKDDPGRFSAGSLGFGFGPKPWWFTEAYIKYEKAPLDRTRYDAFEWENKFQLTEPGKYFADVGLLTEIEVPRERHEEGYEFRFGPLFQWDTGRVQWNANLLFERRFRAHNDEPHVTEMGYQLQVKYRARPEFEYGLQAFGDLGEWNHWASSDEQQHVLGPAVFGRLRVADKQFVRYNAGWLFGLNKGAPDNTFRVQVEYEF